MVKDNSYIYIVEYIPVVCWFSLNTMILLIYDSLFGNTAIIAKKIEDTIRSGGHEVESKRVGEVTADDLKKGGPLVIGAPTQAFNASKVMLEFLDKIDSHSVKGRKVIAFDTRLDLKSIDSKFLRWLVSRGGYATAPITKKLGRKGAVIIGSEGFLVSDREGPLVEGELERAGDWIKQQLSKL